MSGAPHSPAIPAKAGIQPSADSEGRHVTSRLRQGWVPACAGTSGVWDSGRATSTGHPSGCGAGKRRVSVRLKIRRARGGAGSRPEFILGLARAGPGGGTSGWGSSLSGHFREGGKSSYRQGAVYHAAELGPRLRGDEGMGRWFGLDPSKRRVPRLLRIGNIFGGRGDPPANFYHFRAGENELSASSGDHPCRRALGTAGSAPSRGRRGGETSGPPKRWGGL